MINTVSIKIQQNKKGFFTSGSGPEVVFIQGSCRVAPYLQYLNEWNEGIGNNRFTIHSLDPFNLSFDPITDALVDREAAINAMENHQGLRDMLATVDIYIHEWFENFGMFNTFKEQGKSIYDFNLSPKQDICLPNFNDVFILFNDHYKFDAQFRESANSDYKMYGKLSGVTQEWIRKKTAANLDKFYDVCSKSSIPEMAALFKEEMEHTRFFHSFNHISKAFSIMIMGALTENILCLPTTNEYWDSISSYDMFDSDSTPLTEYDVKVFGFDWDELIVSFKEYNKIGV